MQGSAGVHGHGDAESLGKFLFAAAGLEASIGVEGDTALRAETSCTFSPRRERLSSQRKGFGSSEGVRQEFAELGHGFGEFGLPVLPVQHDAILHGCEMRVESIGLGRGCGKVCHFTNLIRGSWNSVRRFRGQHTMW
jgi:hypothetical protein